jgi:GNAT superfamily N-acetyltransferase
MTDVTPASYQPAERDQLFELMHGVGRSHIDDAEFEWWFERNPAGAYLISVARDEGRVVGVAAMSYFRMLRGGTEELVAVPVHVATEAEYRRRGVFSALELRNEELAAEAGIPLTITFPNAASHPIFVGDLGWRDLPRRRLWARPLHAAAVARYLGRRPSTTGGLRPPSPDVQVRRGLTIAPLERFDAATDAVWRAAVAADGGAQFARDASFLNWRYVDSPRDYRRFAASEASRLVGFVVMGHTIKHGVSSGFVADLLTVPGHDNAVVALLERCVDELAPGTDTVIALPAWSQRRPFVQARFLPTHKQIRFIGKPLGNGAVLDTREPWHFTLGDFDFF